MLPTPVRKSKSVFKPEYPFPIIRSDCGEGQLDPTWKCVEGYLQEDCVLVHDEESMKLLYTRGFYGKGTLSKNAPKVCFKNVENTGEQSKRDDLESSNSKMDADVIEVVDVDDGPEAQPPKTDDIEVVLSDSSDSNLEVEVSSAKKETPKPEEATEKESLQLTFEEAYFLSYAFGALVVKDSKDQPIDLARLWNKFCELSPEGNFPVLYTAYHHFRSKGWIVKTGVKYGVDYVLYKDGPPFYHATYSVLVRSVKEQSFREARGNRQMTWGSLLALNRLNASTGKGLLFLYVIKPASISENKISTPFCVSQYKVEEVLFKRWVAEENRE